MKKLSPLLWGWLGGALGSGILFTASNWLWSRMALESPTFEIGALLGLTLLSTFWTGIFMIPGVILATILYFRFPTFRGIRALATACVTGFLTTLICGAVVNGSDWYLFGPIAMTGSVLFWWITTEGERAAQEK